MNSIRSRNNSAKLVASLGMVILMAFFSACDILASEGAREAIANGREVRALEDAELGPLEREMDALYVNEIQPRETKLEDLRYQMQQLEEDLLRPLWDAQGNAWAPGGEASELQATFEARYRELDLLQRSVDVEQRELDARWQKLWSAGTGIDPEFQLLEDLRFEKQRELDRLYRFGYREIDDIWDEINELNSGRNWANTDSQIESEEINAELRRLHDLYQEIQNGVSQDSAQIEEKARVAQDQLNRLYNSGWDPINELYAEIERLESEHSFKSATTVNSDQITAQIAELRKAVAAYELSRDAELAALKATLDVVEPDADSSTNSESTVRIVELQQLIADLEAEAAALHDVKIAEIDDLTGQIAEKTASFDALIDEAQASFLIVSADLLGQVSVLDTQIAGLTELGGEDAVAQIAILQPQRDSLVAQEEAEEEELHGLVSHYESERDGGVAGLQSSIVEIETEIDAGLTLDIDAQVAEYLAELDALIAGVNTIDSNLQASLTTTSADILADIEAAKNYWSELIGAVTAKIHSLEKQLISSDGVNDEQASRIRSLKLQTQELEINLKTQITNLESTVNELYKKVNTASTGDSSRLAEVQTQIDSLNKKLEAIWHRDSASGLENLKYVQELEKRARALEEELEQKTRRLEEELWDVDDKLSLFYKGQESENRVRQAGYEAEMATLQQRRFDLEEQRWALDSEQQLAFKDIDSKIAASGQEIEKIEDEQLGGLRSQIRDLEVEIRSFYGQKKELELAMREARALVEQKKRELEDNVFDLLEDAAGVDSAPGSLIPETTDEGTTPEVGEVVDEPVTSTN
ncbi:MAG: hypothetical protein O3B95_07015 [Chloroflexi bacterium]|nr:hypothetical protein [Chloroflexota bacterium]